MLQVEHLSVSVNQQRILTDITFDVQEGDWLMIVGPNGAGKTSLLKALTTALSFEGKVELLGRDTKQIPAKERARLLGMLAQQNDVSYDFSVREIVELGRYAHTKGWLGQLQPEDQQIIEEAMKATGIQALAKQGARTLSGGEVQRTFLAQVFAQKPHLLVLDEPTNHLDINYEQIIFSLVEAWLKQEGRAVISIVHDLSLAKQYGSHALLLNAGHVEAYGPVDDVLTRENLARVYQTDVYHYMSEKYQQWQ